MNRFIKGLVNGFKSTAYTAPLMVLQPVYAAGETSVDVSRNIVKTVGQFAMPIGAALVFVGLLLSTIKIIASHGKAQKRSEALEGIGWLVGASIALGLISMIFGVIISLSGISSTKADDAASSIQ